MVVLRRAARRRPGAKWSVRIGAVVKQRTHQLFVAAHDRFVQSGKSRRGLVWVGAFLEEKLSHVAEAGMNGQNRRANTPGVSIVDIAPGSDEKPRRSKVPHARREHQRGLAPMRDRLV